MYKLWVITEDIALADELRKLLPQARIRKAGSKLTFVEITADDLTIGQVTTVLALVALNEQKVPMMTINKDWPRLGMNPVDPLDGDGDAGA